MKKLLTYWVLILSLFLLAACGTESEQMQLMRMNAYISPEGRLTKTHLYIHWPAEHTKPHRNDPGGKELVPPLTLKIPIEYLGQNAITFANAENVFLHDN